MLHGFSIVRNETLGIQANHLDVGQFAVLTTGNYKDQPVVMTSGRNLVLLTDPSISEFAFEFDYAQVLKDNEKVTITVNAGTGTLDEKLLGHIRLGNKIQAIKEYREATGQSLLDSKNYVETLTLFHS